MNKKHKQPTKGEILGVLKQQGLENDLKANMRSKLLKHIQGLKPGAYKPESRVVYSLFLDFLTTEGLKFTTSVFIPECGEQVDFLSPLELGQYFKIESPAGSYLLKSILSNYFTAITKPNTKDSSSQSLEMTLTSNLEEKLMNLDMNFAAKKAEEGLGINEKVLKVQRDCEARMKIELQEHVKRIRESEIVSMKLEEAAKYQQQLHKLKADYEKNYQREFDALKLREKKALEAAKRKETEIEAQAYMQRQNYLQDSDATHQKLQEHRRKLDIELEEAQLQRKMWESKTKEYEDKIKEIDMKKKEISLKVNEELLKYKLDFENQFEEEKRKLANDKLEVEMIKKTWNLDSDRLKSSEDQMEVYIYKITKLTKDNENLKNANKQIDKDLQQARTELAILNDSQNRLASQVSVKETELRLSKDEIERLKDIFNELKERMTKMNIEHEMELEKLKRELVSNDGKQFMSDYLIDRRFHWDKLQREEFNIKKGMMDIIKPSEFCVSKAAERPPERPKKEPQVVVKTQFIRSERFSESSDDAI